MRGIVGKILVLACMMVLVLSTLGFADLEVAYGIVQDVDKAIGSITIVTPEGETIVWAAASTLLDQVQEGDRVRIELQEGKVMRVVKATRT